MKTLNVKQTVATILLIVILTMTFNSPVAAQKGRLYLQDEGKHSMALKLVTGQYGDAAGTTPQKMAGVHDGMKYNPRPPDAQNKESNVSDVDRMFGGNKYLAAKQDGRHYSEFEVYNVKGMDMNDMVKGLLTNTLDREKRYNDRGPAEEKVTVTDKYITKLDSKGQIITNNDKAYATAIRLDNKTFVIVGENDYRYIDGKKLEGGKKLISELSKGKPITVTTFFYELEKTGILDKKISLAQFTRMSTDQKQNLMSGEPLAAKF